MAERPQIDLVTLKMSQKENELKICPKTDCKPVMFVLNAMSFIACFLFCFAGVVTIKKETDDKSEEETSSDRMSFPTPHDPDGLHYRVQGTFTRSVLPFFECYATSHSEHIMTV